MHVPYALLEDGTRVLPTKTLREKAQLEGLVFYCPAPKCRAIKGRLLIRGGSQIRTHFYHPRSSKLESACKGGEGAKHMACKLWVRDNADNLNFKIVTPCTRCATPHTIYQGIEGATAKEEVRVGKYLIDVLVQTPTRVYYLEVHHTHACTDEKVQYLSQQPGHLVEFHAEDLSERPHQSAVTLRTTHLTRGTCASCIEVVKHTRCAYPRCALVNTLGVFKSVALGTQFFCRAHEDYATLIKRKRCQARYLHPISNAFVRCSRKNKDYTMRWKRGKLFCAKHYKYGQ